MTNEEIQQIFFVECEESLIAAETGLAVCKQGTEDPDAINAVFRAVHSIKGGAGAFGFIALQAYAHSVETLLAELREGSLTLGAALIDLLLRSLDTLSDHVNAAREGREPPADAELIAELNAAQTGSGDPLPAIKLQAATPAPDAEPAADEDVGASSEFDLDLDAMLDGIVGEIAGEIAGRAASGWPLHLRPYAGAMRNGGEPLLLLREMVALGGKCIHCDPSTIPPLDLFDPEQGYLGWSFTMPAAVSEATVQDIFDFVSGDYALSLGDGAAMPPPRLDACATPAPLSSAPEAPDSKTPDPIPVDAAPVPVSSFPPASPAAPSQGQSIRIDLAKLDRLIDSVGELVIAQAMTAQRLAGEGLATSDELTLLEALTRDIQESAMSIRTQPIGSAFSRVPRILRELASATDKHVKLELSGEGTELDKTVIERLGEPLTHLIRNAVDHGIENPADRLAAGKSAEGTLKLSAEQRSGRILIRIADDGRGIDRQRVFAKAVEKGLVSPDTQLSNEEIDNLIFVPGFSTAVSVTSVSGRGVGMDVVRQNVKELGGRITIESEEGKGTCFTLTLPLTLAISDGMIVSVGDQQLVVPLAHVVECLRPAPGDVQGLGSRHQMLNVRGQFIPVLPLCNVIGASCCPASPDNGVLVIVETEMAGQAALLVDDICDQRQFVIKSLNTHYHAVEGVAGATILGDGKVALILDVDGLVASAMAAPERQAV
jgi:two-component system chemotaxis sensor kinase CheA